MHAGGAQRSGAIGALVARAGVVAATPGTGSAKASNATPARR